MLKELNEKAENVECFDLKKLGKNQAVFLKTADNCYFITYFVHIVTLGSPNITTLIIKDFAGNKSQKGKKVSFGKTIGSCDENLKIGGCFSYTTARDSVTIEAVSELMVGYFQDVEQHFLETIKKMLGVNCLNSLTMAS